MTLNRIFFTLYITLFFSIFGYADNSINLAGEWQFQIDRNNQGETQQWYKNKLSDIIYLPGSMPEMDKGDMPGINTQWTASLYDSSFFFNPYMDRFRKEGNYKVPFFLTPKKHFIGAAWYNKEVVIPSNWKNERII